MINKLRALGAAALMALASIGYANAQAVQTPPGEVCFQATTGTNGYIGLLGTITGGSGGTNGSYGGVALTGGSGTGATANVTVSGGRVSRVSILNPGIQYVVGDVLSAASGTVGGVAGFSIPVSSTSINSSLAGGTAGMYVPSTLTAKQTWKDAGELTLNTNPVALDSNGCALIYGTGTYRQILKDSLGNTVWDQNTTVPVVTAVTGPNSSTAGDVATWNNTAGSLLADTPGASVNVTVPGSSAARALGQRFGQEFNILDYGAKCDGLTNDGVAIQAAVTAAQNAGGGLVRIPVSQSGCVDTGTLNVTANSVTIAGSGLGGSSLLFNNGSLDSIVVGTGRGTAQVYYFQMRDLTVNHSSGKSGGTALKFASAADAIVQHVFLNGVWNGMSFDETNNILSSYVVVNGKTNSGGNGINFVTAGNDPSIRSDVLALTDVTVNMHASAPGTSECLHVDGFSNDIRAKSLGLLDCGSYGLHIVNTAASNAYFPGFGEFYDLEIDGEWSEAVRIEAGDDWLFVHATIDSINDINPSDAIVEVFPDTGHSETRHINFTGSFISDGPGTCFRMNGGRDSTMVGSTVADCGKYAGANGLGGAQPAVPVIELGATTNGFTAAGNIIGFAFGQCCSGSNNYAVQLDAGAMNVTLGTNNYRLFNGTTTTSAINNLAGAELVMTNGGINYDGNAFGPTFTPVGPGGRNQVTLTNSGVTAASGSQFSASTGTASAFTLMTNLDGATPIGSISTGAGDAGGLELLTGAGPINLQPTGALEIGGVAGVTCPTGAPSASFATVKGIVTHC